MAFETLLPSDLEIARLYDLMTALIVPRPIAFVSTVSEEGAANLAPFSYFMPGGLNPPSLAFCPVLGPDGRAKDTLANIRATGEFVVNAVHGAMAQGVNDASFKYDPDESEWRFAGFTPTDSKIVRPKRVAESLAQFECKLHEIALHGTSANSSAYVIGEVVAIHIDEQVDLVGGAEPFRPLARLSAKDYWDFEAESYVRLARPNRPSKRPVE